MFEIGKTFRFAAAHRLPNLPSDHQCFRLHGHNYEVDIVLRSETLTPTEQWVVDYGEMSATIGAWIRGNLDHRNLNDWIMNPTAEVLARHLWEVIKSHGNPMAAPTSVVAAWHPLAKNLHRVVVRETGGTWAAYSE